MAGQDSSQVIEAFNQEKAQLINNHEKEKELLLKKANELEEQQKNQLAQINRLLLEKDELQSQQIKTKDLLLQQERLNRYLNQSHIYNDMVVN